MKFKIGRRLAFPRSSLGKILTNSTQHPSSGKKHDYPWTSVYQCYLLGEVGRVPLLDGLTWLATLDVHDLGEGAPGFNGHDPWASTADVEYVAGLQILLSNSSMPGIASEGACLSSVPSVCWKRFSISVKTGSFNFVKSCGAASGLQRAAWRFRNLPFIGLVWGAQGSARISEFHTTELSSKSDGDWSDVSQYKLESTGISRLRGTASMIRATSGECVKWAGESESSWSSSLRESSE